MQKVFMPLEQSPQDGPTNAIYQKRIKKRQEGKQEILSLGKGTISNLATQLLLQSYTLPMLGIVKNIT